MSANSSFFNDSHLGPNVVTFDYFQCFITSPAVFVLDPFFITYILLLLPLIILIFYICFQQVKQKTPPKAISHCDSFTYHMVGMETIGILGCTFYFCGNCMKYSKLVNIGINIFYFPWYGQTCFHSLTCVERYLAVVHPITYLSLRSEKWIRIRNISIGCVWLLCFVANTIVSITNIVYSDIFFLTPSTTIISFCSLRVLCVLIRPGPGGQGEGRDRVDQSKQRAFYTIVVILGVLLMRLSFGLVSFGLELSTEMSLCMIIACSVWINLPSSLVLPLLFLQRTRHLVFCKM